MARTPPVARMEAQLYCCTIFARIVGIGGELEFGSGTDYRVSGEDSDGARARAEMSPIDLFTPPTAGRPKLTPGLEVNPRAHALTPLSDQSRHFLAEVRVR